MLEVAASYNCRKRKDANDQFCEAKDDEKENHEWHWGQLFVTFWNACLFYIKRSFKKTTKKQEKEKSNSFGHQILTIDCLWGILAIAKC